MLSSIAQRSLARASSALLAASLPATTVITHQTTPLLAAVAVTHRALPIRLFGAKPGPAPIADPKPCADDEIPSIFDQATGLERAEIDHPDIFKHNEVLRGPFGTKDNPVKIQSAYDYRIVGCTGRSSPNDHDIVWLKVEKDKLACCPECNQYFALDPL